MIAAWEHEFAAGGRGCLCGAPRIEALLPEVDAVISPGNSYGQMDGGVDRVLSQLFPLVQRNVWAMVGDQYHGYQPVGTAAIVATGGVRCPWLVYAPTMRVPMPLGAGLDIAVHDDVWAALRTVAAHNDTSERDNAITTVIAPGFGTGYGRVPAARAAQLMAAAYHFMRNPSTASISERETYLEA